MRSWIGGYLALCLAVAGAIGLSPDLHRLFEHGGQGRPHVHRGTPPPAEGSPAAFPTHAPDGHRHDPGDLGHTHAAAADAPLPDWMRPSPPKPAWEHHRDRVRETSFPALWAWIVARMDAAAENGIPDPHERAPEESGDPVHRHESLPQLLAAGGLECSAVVFFEPPGPTPSPRVLPKPASVIPSGTWDAQSAGRAPPTPAA